ncbi:MAG: two-component system response regulator AlgR [Pseudomonadales bacterium]|jgi:two-component system response regulator AlgR
MTECNVLVVDDEPLARARVKRMLADIDGVRWLGEAADGYECLSSVEALRPDVVLLDIRMPGMDGVEAAKHMAELETPPAVIFCTAYDEYALAAFDTAAVDYLVKPIRSERLAQALQKASRLTQLQLTQVAKESDSKPSNLCINSHKGMELIPVASIRCFIADQKYVTILHDKGEVLFDRPLKSLEEEFGSMFIRVHRNALVAHAHIEGLERDPTGHFNVVLKGIEIKPAVSRRHLSELREKLSNS